MSWRVRNRTGETVLGQTTYGQVSDYVRVCEFDNAQLDKALSNCKAWIASDPAGFQAMNERADAISRRLPDIVRRANAHQGYEDAAIDVETKQAYDDLHAWRRDLNALYLELSKDPHGCELPKWDAEPQPQATDPQLDAYKEAHKATDVIEETADKVGRVAAPVAGIVVAVGVGLLVLSAVGRR